MKDIFLGIGVLAYIWFSAYTFVLFPWKEGAVEWWHLPHLISLIGGYFGFVYGIIWWQEGRR